MTRAGRFDADADELLRPGREDVAQRDWESAFRLLSDAHARRPLGRLGEAGYWTDRHEDSFECQRGAYHAYAKPATTRRQPIWHSW
jgi:hypothetical protein